MTGILIRTYTVPGLRTFFTIRLNMNNLKINLQDRQCLISALQALTWLESTMYQHSKWKIMAICSFSMSILFLLLELDASCILVTPEDSFPAEKLCLHIGSKYCRVIDNHKMQRTESIC